MILSNEMHQAMELIESMSEEPFGDPDKKIFRQLEELENEVPANEKEFFGDLWEAYIVSLP